MEYSHLFVLLLSLVPFIEARGAMFFGFSLGITDPLFYAFCSAINIAQAAAYGWVFSHPKIAEAGIWKAAERLAVRHAPKGISPSFFLLGIPAFGNGINSFTSSAIAHFARMRGALPYIAGGIAARDVLTFLLLSGASMIVEPILLRNALQLLFMGYILIALFRCRHSLMQFAGVRVRGIRPQFFIGIVLCLLIAAAVLLSQDAAVAAKRLFSLVYTGRSDGKMLIFLGFFALFFLAKSSLAADKRGGGKAAWAIFGLFAALSVLSLALTSLLISDFRHAALEQGLETPPFERAIVESVEVREGPYNGYIMSNSRLNHNHLLKTAAFLPIAYIEPDLDATYNMGLGFASHLPYPLLLLGFLLILLLVCTSFLFCARLRVVEGALFAFLFFVAIGSLVDAGPLSSRFHAALLGIAIISMQKEKWGGPLLVALALLFAGFHYMESKGYPDSLLQVSFSLLAFLLSVHKKWHLAFAALAAVIALGIGNESGQLVAAAAFLAIALFGIGMGGGRVLAALAGFFVLLDCTLYSPAKAAMPAFYLSAAWLANGRGVQKLLLLGVLLVSAYFLLPAEYASEKDNFQADFSGKELLVFIDSREDAKPSQGLGEPIIRLEGGAEVYHAASYPYSSIRSAFDGPAPRGLQYGNICRNEEWGRLVAIAIFRSGCAGDISGKTFAVDYGQAETVMKLAVQNQNGRCTIVIESEGNFAGCVPLEADAVARLSGRPSEFLLLHMDADEREE